MTFIQQLAEFCRIRGIPIRVGEPRISHVLPSRDG